MNDNWNNINEDFIYTGQENDDIPVDVIRVIVHPSVSVIRGRAFLSRSNLTTVLLSEGLEEIGEEAFAYCTSLREILIPPRIRLDEIGEAAFAYCASLQEILIPPRVRVIRRNTFCQCTGLTTVNGGEGLEEIGVISFNQCTSLREIVIHPQVRVIQEGAFYLCSQLADVILGEGLEEIGDEAFGECTSIQHVEIPRGVKFIHGAPFHGCSNLSSLTYCEEIEEFVSGGSMRHWWNRGFDNGWWNRGFGDVTLSTYCFLVRCNIPQRLGLVLVRSWKYNIHEMLRRIPTKDWGLRAYFDSINSKLSYYENISEAPMLLELVIPKNDVVLRILSYL
jgi:hypothetical protein